MWCAMLQDTSIPDCNVTHGVLLTLRMLLRTHCDVPTKCDADRLAAEMKAHLWLIDNQTTPAAIRIEFIRILSILQTLLSQADFSHMRLEMSRILDGVILNAEEWSRGVDPLVPLWLKVCERTNRIVAYRLVLLFRCSFICNQWSDADIFLTGVCDTETSRVFQS